MLFSQIRLRYTFILLQLTQPSGPQKSVKITDFHMRNQGIQRPVRTRRSFTVSLLIHLQCAWLRGTALSHVLSHRLSVESVAPCWIQEAKPRLPRDIELPLVCAQNRGSLLGCSWTCLCSRYLSSFPSSIHPSHYGLSVKKKVKPVISYPLICPLLSSPCSTNLSPKKHT